MRRMAFAVLALAAALCGFLFTASVAGAQAPAATISVTGQETTWSPSTVTVTTGDTVRWSFDGSELNHNVRGTSSNWDPPLNSPLGIDQDPVDYTFTAPGVYTFICDVHGAGMSGTVTVEDPGADPLENVLVFSKTAGFRHTSIDEGIVAIQELGADNDFEVDATEDSAQFTSSNLAQYDAVVFLSTTGDVLTDEQQDAFEDYMQGGGGFVGIHAAADTEYEWPWYGEMIGGYFRNHPPGTPTATVNIEDGDEPSTEGLPADWVRVDEWYNYQSPVDPVVNGGGDDYSPRDSDVHVLATVDESTYDEQDGNATDDDHPISWCSDFDGGHVWYTGMGHTEASFGTAEGNLRSHILGGLETVTGAEPSDCGEPREATPEPSDFEMVTIDDDTESPMEIAVASDGRVFYVERITGELNVYNPVNGQVTTAITIPVSSVQENGAMGIALDPNFDTNNHLYVTYTPPTPNNVTRVSRFTVGPGNTIDPASEQFIFQWIAQRQQCCHSAGSLAFAPNGDLYISTGDNTNPFASDGFTPIDERPGREFWDAQRTSANSNDHNGKILRIHPLPDATGTPGIGTTYSIPDGNMFEPGTADTLPEIYAMGFRNPFRITVDPHTGWVLVGNYGPDASATVANRGPQGSVEFEVVKEPGFYGWPYCVRDNVPYNDYDFQNSTSGPTFDCANLTNDSPNNTGIEDLPPAIPATMWMGYSETDPRVPGLGPGGAPTGGPRYQFDPDLDSPTKFPEYFDEHWFIGEWNSGWLRTATLDGDGDALGVFQTPWEDTFFRIHEIEFGPDGSLYVIDWGSGFSGNNANSGIYRIDYIAGARRPIARATSDVDNGPLPLTVQFSSDGSEDPDGTSLTYAWDFDGDGTTDSTDANPTHIYTTAGTFNATLTVTDGDGQTGFDTIPITAGNTRPTVEITIPTDGQFAAFGDIVPYEITVTDPEDGDEIDCEDVTLSIQLGHDDHAHGLGQQQGCSGTFQTMSDSGHGANANIFTSIVASYTDSAQGAAGALTGQDDVVLHPKPKQAEFFDSTGRVAGSPAGGDPGVQTETTTDAGGGLNIGFIERGDYVSFERVSLEELTGIRFRVASGGAGGTIEARLDAPDGELAGSVAVAPTGGWQNWTDVTMDLPTPPEGTHELFLVFTHPSDNGGLFNLNHFTALGKGAANSAAPEVTASAEPTGGDAPLEVQFTGTATDPDAEPGEELTYEWDFGVAGTTDDTSDELSPTYTYERPGTYLARFTATDPNGASATASVQVEVTSSSECPENNVRSDEFEGDSLDTNRWQIIRPDDTRPPTVSGGNLNFPIDVGSIYGPGTSARNIIVQPLPSGEVEVTAKITTEPLTENFQQAGLRVYQDDDNWASVHMIYAGGNRDFEFIYENAGAPRNEGQDKLGGIPADAPLTYWVKLISDGSQLTAEYSYDGVDFDPVGRPADISGWAAPQVGPTALSDAATTYPVASFDWIRFNPDSSGGGGGGGDGEIVDEFDGSSLGADWTVVRENQNLAVSGGALRIPASPGDIYGGRNDAANLVMRDAPDGAWQATAKLNFEGTAQYHQAGIMVYGDDANFTKFGRIAHTAAGDEKFEFIYENAGTPRNEAADSTGNIPTDFPDDFWVRMNSDGTNVTGEYSTDGSTWTPVGRPAPLPADAKIGLFAFSNDGTGDPEAAFDSFTLSGENVGGGGGPSGPSFDDEFDGSSLDTARWNAIVRDNPAAYEVAGGELTITTEAGDIYTGDTNPPPNNFILQDASHAGEDWVIETKLSGTISSGYAQGGLMAHTDGDNYVKFDAISDPGGETINRIELRSEVGGAIQNPQQNVAVSAADGAGDIWLRLAKTGTEYAGEYSYDGETWTAFPGGPVPNAMAAPDFGLFAFGPQADGQGETVSFDYFWLDGQDPPTDPCECPPTGGDSFDSGPLDTGRWNAIVRPQDDLIAFNDGWLEVTTVNGDIYTGGDPAPTRNFILQNPTEAGQDWVIETHIDAAELSGGYEQAGLMVRADDDNYIKYDIISDEGQTVLNRLELRSEIAGAIQQPQPADPPVPAGATEVWLRLTKTGDSYAGEYSFDGENYSAVSLPVTNPMVDPAFGIFTLGVNSGGGTARFEYFSLDGNAGECEEPEPENAPPVIADVTASPETGFAPLEVDFTVAASDADEDPLTYAWDFDGDGTTDSTDQNPTHTYTEEGDYEAEVTVSDGEAERSRTVTVNVFGETDPEARFRVLVFSKTAGFRHDSIDEGHAAIELLGEENDFQVDHTEDASIFNDDALANYDSVIWLSTTGDVLDDTQQAAFEAYIQGGGGYTGIHAAADTEYDWKWYGELVGAYFLSHPPGTPNADVLVEDPDDHTTNHLDGPVWNRDDEWYNYKPVDFEDTGNVDYSPRESGVHVLLTVDESTYDEQDGNATDDDHPISWCKRYDGGRSWYTGMGHTAASFSEDDYVQHILGGIEVSAGAADSAECGVVDEDPNAPIVEAFGDPISGSVPLRVEFSSSAIDPNGPRLPNGAFRWEFGDGSSRFGRNPVHVYREAGVYTATLTVTDPEGKTGTDTVQITVNEPGNMVPMVDVAADPASGTPPLTVRFEAVAIDPDGPENRITYEWDFGDDTGGQFGRVVRHTYRSAGEYTATVTATDERGGSASKSIVITVDDPPGNQAPSVRALADPTSGTAPLRVRLSSAPMDVEDGDNLLVTWNFGDGTSGGGEALYHTYTAPGTYTATVTVRDTGGLTATDTVQITVTGSQGAGGGGQGVVAPPPRNAGDVEGETESSPSVRLAKRQKVARVVKRGLRYRVVCETACRVKSTLRIRGGDKQRLGKARARRIAAGDSRRIVLRLSRNVRRNLATAMRQAKVRRLRATLVLKIRTAEGTSTVRKAVVLRR